MESRTPAWLKGMKIPGWQKRDDLFIVPPGGWLLAATMLLCVFLAGGRPLWAQGITTVGIGLLWILHTPAKLPSRAILSVLVLLALLPLTAFLPGSWLAMPSWRSGLREFEAITSSVFVTPQPWLTFHCYLLWLTGLALATWCACQDWDHYNRGTLARIYAGGMLAITLFALFGHFTGYQPSWWTSTDGFGPFLNRNQWGAALGFAGVTAIALIHQCVRQEHKSGVVFWTLAAAVFTGSVIFNGSRGGFIVLIGGGFAYWGFYGVIRQQYRYAAIGISFLLISFALFALGGGDLLERFVSLRGLVEGGAAEDTRVQFYRMTVAMIAGSPLAGFGLGNFEYVFPFYLDFEPLYDRRPVHPESSWLWLASEGGWLMLAAMAIALIVLIMQSMTAKKSRASTIRSLGLACALMLAFNAGFEVSAHRIGTLFPVIMLAALALPPPKGGALGTVLRGGAKSCGLLLVATGLLWIAGAWGIVALPTVQGSAPLLAKAMEAKTSSRLGEAVELLQRCERLRPLDWNVHWTLSDWLLEEKKINPAWQQFLAANALLPYLYWTIEKGAEKWIGVSAGMAARAMMEAVTRAPEARRAEIYGSFLRKSASDPALRSTLLRLYPDNLEFELVRIRQSSPEVSAKRLRRLVARTDNLAQVPDDIAASALRLMLDGNQISDIDAIVTENPRLKRAVWQVLVDREARGGNTKAALDLYFNYGPRPAIPAALSRSDLRSVERAAAMAPLDVSTAIAYYQALAAAQRDDDALWQLRRIMELPKAPAYIWFLAAQTIHRRGDSNEAWNFLQTYLEKSKK